jgi:hypothetical protein
VLCVVACARDAAHQLLEWATWLRAQGFERLYLADHRPSSDGTSELIERLATKVPGLLVTAEAHTGPFRQGDFLKSLCRRALEDCRGRDVGLFFLDTDEFILPPEDGRSVRECVAAMLARAPGPLVRVRMPCLFALPYLASCQEAQHVDAPDFDWLRHGPAFRAANGSWKAALLARGDAPTWHVTSAHIHQPDTEPACLPFPAEAEPWGPNLGRARWDKADAVAAKEKAAYPLQFLHCCFSGERRHSERVLQWVASAAHSANACRRWHSNLYDWKTVPASEQRERLLVHMATDQGRRHVYRFALRPKSQAAQDWESRVARFFGRPVPEDPDAEALERLRGAVVT